jgi:uncharacterized membrane protein YjjB (DUF3815 family)
MIVDPPALLQFVDPPHLMHQALFGAVAAWGFGVLFNFGWRDLFWCAASGALALATRTLGQEAGWNLETASFVAAAAVGVCERLLRARLGIASNALAVAGCIPMVPGSFAAQAIFGLFTLTAPQPGNAAVMVSTMEYMLRVAFTIGAIGAGLSITTHIFEARKG